MPNAKRRNTKSRPPVRVATRQDATIRNVRAAKKRATVLKGQLDHLEGITAAHDREGSVTRERLESLGSRLSRLEERVKILEKFTSVAENLANRIAALEHPQPIVRRQGGK